MMSSTRVSRFGFLAIVLAVSASAFAANTAQITQSALQKLQRIADKAEVKPERIYDKWSRQSQHFVAQGEDRAEKFMRFASKSTEQITREQTKFERDAEKHVDKVTQQLARMDAPQMEIDSLTELHEQLQAEKEMFFQELLAQVQTDLAEILEQIE